MQKKTQIKQLILRIFILIICVVAALMVLFPLYFLLTTVTHNDDDIILGNIGWFGTSFFDNLKVLNSIIKKKYSIPKAFLNSCFISFVSTGLCIYFSSLTAYACHVYDFKGKKFFEKFILFLIIIPGQLGAVGFFKMVFALRMDDTYIPFIFPAIASASTVYFLRQYLKANFSKEYVDAARMDGANEFMIFNKICLPYIKAGLATMALFGIIASWNNFMGPLTFLTSRDKFTLPQIVYYLTLMEMPEYGAYYVGVFITTLPMLIVYFFLSKVIMKGVSNGGLKS